MSASYLLVCAAVFNATVFNEGSTASAWFEGPAALMHLGAIYASYEIDSKPISSRFSLPPGKGRPRASRDGVATLSADWHVPDFQRLLSAEPRGQSVYSEPFALGEHVFRMMLFPAGNGVERYVSLYLVRRCMTFACLQIASDAPCLLAVHSTDNVGAATLAKSPV